MPKHTHSGNLSPGDWNLEEAINATLSVLKPWQQQALLRTLASPAFRQKAQQTIKMFLVLIRASFPDQIGKRTEKALVEALGGEGHGIRAVLGQFRNAVAKAKSESSNETWHIEIDMHLGNKVRFVRHCLNEFWAPHLAHAGTEPACKTTIVYDEPRFFRAPTNDYFIRHRDINEHTALSKGQAPEKSVEKSIEEIAEECKLHNLPDMFESHHYVGAGDARCLLSITLCLERRRVNTSHAVAHLHPTWDSLESPPAPRAPLILIGNARTHWAVRAIQEEEAMDIRFQITARGISNPLHPNQPFRDEDHSGGNKSRDAYALLVRRLDTSSSRIITCILANQGPVFDLLGFYLTDEHQLSKLIPCLGLAEDDLLPEEFEIVFQIKVSHKDHSIPGSLKPIAFRLDRKQPVILSTAETPR